MALALGLAVWPLRHAWFSTDDFTHLALVRQAANPLLFFVADPTSNYTYRPFGMLVWWLTGVLFGADAHGHYLFNVLLHLGVALALGHLIHRLTGKPALSWLAGGAFALHPGMLSVGIWSASRFDVLAALFCLLCLIRIERAADGRGRWLPVIAWAACAAFSKEISLVLLPALAVHLWTNPGSSPRARLCRIALAAAPFCLVLAAHQFLLASMETQLNLTRPFAGILRGALGWIESLPDAMAGRPLRIWPALSIGTLIIALLAALTILARDRRIDWRWALTAALLTFGPMFLQAPVFQLILTVAEPLSLPVNFRFYYLSGIGCLLALSLALAPLDVSAMARRATAALAILMLASFALRAHGAMSNWANGTGGEARRVVEAATEVARTFGADRPCTVFLLDVPNYILEFPIVSDAAIKSILPRGHPALGCIFVTERSPARNFTHGVACDDASWRPFVPRIKGNAPVAARPFGGLCVHHFADLPAPLRDQAPQPRVLRWRDGAFKPERAPGAEQPGRAL